MTNKKAAMELSISTIVVIVLAMSMLILGLVLVRSIFAGAKYNVDGLNKNVEAEINKLFNEKNLKTYIYLPNNQADVKKGSSFSLNFGIRNDAQGESKPSTFTYEIIATNIQEGCDLTLEQANSYIVLRRTGSIELSPGGEPTYRVAKISPPSTAPLCEVAYDLVVKKSDQVYDTNFFNLKITG